MYILCSIKIISVLFYIQQYLNILNSKTDTQLSVSIYQTKQPLYCTQRRLIQHIYYNYILVFET